MKNIRLMRILSIAAMLLSFGVTADAQRVSNRFPGNKLLGLLVQEWLLTPLIVFTIKK